MRNAFVSSEATAKICDKNVRAYSLESNANSVELRNANKYQESYYECNAVTPILTNKVSLKVFTTTRTFRCGQFACTKFKHVKN